MSTPIQAKDSRQRDGGMEEEMETVTEAAKRDAEFLLEAKRQIEKGICAARLEVMRADAPAPVSPSIDSEFETIAEPPAHLIAERAKQLQLQEKARGTNISISQAVAAIMPRNWRRNRS